MLCPNFHYHRGCHNDHLNLGHNRDCKKRDRYRWWKPWRLWHSSCQSSLPHHLPQKAHSMFPPKFVNTYYSWSNQFLLLTANTPKGISNYKYVWVYSLWFWQNLAACWKKQPHGEAMLKYAKWQNLELNFSTSSCNFLLFWTNNPFKSSRILKFKFIFSLTLLDPVQKHSWKINGWKFW